MCINQNYIFYPCKVHVAQQNKKLMPYWFFNINFSQWQHYNQNQKLSTIPQKRSPQKSQRSRTNPLTRTKGLMSRTNWKLHLISRYLWKKTYIIHINIEFIHLHHWKQNYLNFRGEKEKSKDHKLSTGVKRKHHGEKKEERRGRPRKIDKERSLMSTPVTHVHVCNKK